MPGVDGRMPLEVRDRPCHGQYPMVASGAQAQAFGRPAEHGDSPVGGLGSQGDLVAAELGVQDPTACRLVGTPVSTLRACCRSRARWTRSRTAGLRSVTASAVNSAAGTAATCTVRSIRSSSGPESRAV